MMGSMADRLYILLAQKKDFLCDVLRITQSASLDAAGDGDAEEWIDNYSTLMESREEFFHKLEAVEQSLRTDEMARCLERQLKDEAAKPPGTEAGKVGPLAEQIGVIVSDIMALDRENAEKAQRVMQSVKQSMKENSNSKSLHNHYSMERNMDGGHYLDRTK